MADRQVLLALAIRCETEEPSASLDAAIYIAVCIPAGQAERVDVLDNVVGWKPKGAPYSSAKKVPNYTSSIDAAVTLVPEGWNWAAELFSFDRQGAKASVWRDSRNPKERIFNIEAKMPALAICAAALRARAGEGAT